MHRALNASNELCAFPPDAARVQRLDARMRTRLGESLREVAQQARGHIEIPEQALAGFLARVESHPVPPLVFGAYYELVLALESGALVEASALLGEIVSSPPALAELVVIDLEADSEQGPCLYRRLFDSDPSGRIDLNPPGSELSEPYRAKIDQALALIGDSDPELAAELRSLVREIVLAKGGADSDALQFGGVSSFMLWGAIALNVDFPLSTVEMVEALAHESAHNLLFGLSIDEPLLSGDADARYPSPLRKDLRHLDGIYHATFVCARMHRALAQLLAVEAFHGNDLEEAQKAMGESAKHFAQGLKTVLSDAALTPMGRRVMDGAREYMDRAKVLTPI